MNVLPHLLSLPQHFLLTLLCSHQLIIHLGFLQTGSGWTGLHPRKRPSPQWPHTGSGRCEVFHRSQGGPGSQWACRPGKESRAEDQITDASGYIICSPGGTGHCLDQTQGSMDQRAYWKYRPACWLTGAISKTSWCWEKPEWDKGIIYQVSSTRCQVLCKVRPMYYCSYHDRHLRQALVSPF